MRNTDINKVRNLAITFAHLPIEANEKIPFLVSHPFIDTSVTMLPGENGPELVNLLENDGEERFKKEIVQRLKETDTIARFIMMVSKSYRFTFLDHIKGYLSNEDLAGCLRYIWKNSEYTNSGSFLRRNSSSAYFAKAPRKS